MVLATVLSIGASRAAAGPITIPVHPVHVASEEADPGDNPHGLIERDEGIYLYERATGRLLALLPKLDAGSFFSQVQGQSIDQTSAARTLPANLHAMPGWPAFFGDAIAGAPAVGATVSATWTLPNGEEIPQTGVTDATGQATVQIPEKAPGTYWIEVTDIVKEGFTFDPVNSVLIHGATR